MAAAFGKPTAISEVLAASGRVGRDLLELDWEATGLGPPEGWEHSLQTIVTTLVGSRFSMWMAWGPQLTFFCNDAYRTDTLGVKYPWALGRPASEVWAEIWPDIGPRIERVLREGEATWDEALLLFLERSGFVEETYHTFSYSPLRGDDGAVRGMLCVVTEDTKRVIGERRIDLLRRLAMRASSVMDEADLLAAIASELEGEGRALPFTLGYLLDEEGATARLAWSSGLAAGHEATPTVLEVDGGGRWPLRARAGPEGVLVTLDDAFGELPTGGLPEPPTTALVIELNAPGGARPFGFLVAGLNRYRPLDPGYRSFVGLVAGQVATAVGSARSYEAERRRAEQLAELDAAKTAFFMNVSHEFRTPLTLMLGPVEDLLADRDEPLSPTQRRRAELAVRNAERLLGLVNTLLDFSRSAAGEATGAFAPTDLAKATAELAAMFESAIRLAGLSFDVQALPLPDPVYVDREMWATIVINLLSNAFKFTFVGGITLRLAAEGDEVELTVTDTGPGIEPADQAHLFERFHRVSGVRSRTNEGSGIGLASVAQLVALHGGTVFVDSTPGLGSTFGVRLRFGTSHLPADQLAEADVEAGQRGPSVQARAIVAQARQWAHGDSSEHTGSPPLDEPPVEPEGGRAVATEDPDAPLVLVVDDNPDLRAYVARLLSRSYRVETAVDGADGLAKARANPPDLVLTDVMMPNLDGFGLLEALRADPGTLAVPVVFLSARAGAEGTAEGLEAGADDYLVKPFSTRELLARVRANLELDRSRRVRAELEASHALLDQAQRLAHVGSWEIDLASGRVSGSAEYFRLLGIDPVTFRADLPDALVQYVHPDDRDSVAKAIEAARQGVPIELELRIVRRDGRELPTLARGELWRDADGNPVSLRGSLQDLSAQRVAEQASAAVAAAQAGEAREHRIADELQRSLLPPLSFVPDHLEVTTFYRAGVEGTRVGGDWYDVFELPGGRSALVLGDVMGHGVGAAALMAQVRSVVRAYAALDLPPLEVLQRVDAIVRTMGEEGLATCVYAVYEPEGRVLSWANAGHLPPLLGTLDGEVRPLAGSVPPLGVGPFTPPAAQRRSVPEGAVLALYSDGLVERRGRTIDEGIELLARHLGGLAASGRGSARTLAEALVRDGSRQDDVAVLLARVLEG